MLNEFALLALSDLATLHMCYELSSELVYIGFCHHYRYIQCGEGMDYDDNWYGKELQKRELET